MIQAETNIFCISMKIRQNHFIFAKLKDVIVQNEDVFDVLKKTEIFK